jgi:alkylation response protein AidB-like acyl-CoA dehydrogenase
MMEELGYACPSYASFLMLPMFFNRLVLQYLPHKEQEAFRQELADRFVVTSFAATEREAGSDLRSMQTVASPTASGYCLEGRKEYSSNARQSSYVIVVANDTSGSEEAGLSWFLVPTQSAGVTIGPRWDTLGLRAMDLSPISLSNVEIPGPYRLGRQGQGLSMMADHLSQSRTGIAALAVGVARRARDLVIALGSQRRLYGAKLTRLQDYRLRIADMEKDIAAARGLVWLSAVRYDREHQHAKEASIAKLYAGEMVMRVTLAATTMLGSVGYTGQTIVEKLLRDARHVAIVEGSEASHREMIFAQLLRHGAD